MIEYKVSFRDFLKWVLLTFYGTVIFCGFDNSPILS